MFDSLISHSKIDHNWLNDSDLFHTTRQMSVMSLNSFDIHPERNTLITGGDTARLYYHCEIN